MKIILMIILGLLVNEVLAQPKILTREEATKENFKADDLPVSYSEESITGSMQDVMKLFDAALAKVLPENLNPGVGVEMQVFVNASGKIDYLIFNVEHSPKYDNDSLNQVIKKAFTASAVTWEMTVKPSKPVRFMGFRYFGKFIVKREVRKTDSSVVTIEDALVFVDTLKIKRIFFNQLDLNSLPEVIYRFPNLEELYLSNNGLEMVQIDFTKLPRLKQLHIQNNVLTNDGLVLSKNSTLEVLNIRENKFTNIPDAARNCKKLASLWLGGNSLSALSNRSFKKLKQIRDLNFYKSELAVLPKGIKKMKNLEVLDLYYNQFEKLPNSLTKLKNITHLAISHNQITTLPPKMNRLKKVHTFYAHHNRLSALPESISKMNKINILDLGFNWFTNFPAELASLQDLKELDISSNNFSAFPEKLLEIKKLDKLYLQGNPFVGKDMDIKYEHQLGVLKKNNVEVFY
ncbi:leucine-rich repeat domain-containing protein [Dyadobacter sp. CY345]|uniref:leucine-rich repeat domain-containing protein n=1 Tax=Dyadobacter sp. CY345 TaxID=2909335 RepID=UPI001F22A7F7|nr:leucine-rich repeat domain-containing protein [Dyadobacter sp. CY345]MCF2443132.1 leucine-rich repeat domain-containing protein [Dyadobacter sp. CY345]